MMKPWLVIMCSQLTTSPEACNKAKLVDSHCHSCVHFFHFKHSWKAQAIRHSCTLIKLATYLPWVHMIACDPGTIYVMCHMMSHDRSPNVLMKGTHVHALIG